MAAIVKHDCVKKLAWDDMFSDLNLAVLEANILANIHDIEACRQDHALPTINQTYLLAAYQL